MSNQEIFSLRMEGFFTPKESGTHTLALTAVGWSKLYLDDKLVIDHSADSDMATSKLLTELKLKGGKSYAIKLEYFWKGSPRWRSVSFGHQPPHHKDTIAEAVKLARKVRCGCVGRQLERRMGNRRLDRVDMKLPGAQNELIERVAKANKNTIVV